MICIRDKSCRLVSVNGLKAQDIYLTVDNVRRSTRGAYSKMSAKIEGHGVFMCIDSS